MRNADLYLPEARIELQENLDRGSICPCCGQFAKRYRRKLNSGLAVSLIQMYHHSRMEPTVLSGVVVSKHAASLWWWGLIKPFGKNEWRISPEGEGFLQGSVRVPKYAVLYNGVVQEMDGPDITIREALGDTFDYDELMA